MEYFKFLPMEIALEILTRLPIESVLDCKLVCTTWRNLVGHQSFSKLHFNRHSNHEYADSGKLGFLSLTRSTVIGNENFEYFEYNESNESTPIQGIRRIKLTSPFMYPSIVGSCNGLICFCQSSVLPRCICNGLICVCRVLSFAVRPHCVCNPITKEYVVLPEFKINCKIDKYIHCTSGFGYVSSTNEYKVVGVYISNNNQCIEVHIYTLGSGLGWRNLGNFSSKFRKYPWQQRQGVFANGALYWLNHELKMIVAFDLAGEVFCENLSTPPLPLEGGNWKYNRLGVLHGVLYFAIHLVVEGAQCYDVWLLKKRKDNHGTKELGEEHRKLGWSKEFRVYDSELLAVTKGDGVLCCWDRYLNFYDAKASTSKWLVDLKKLVLQVIPHKNTLVSLKEIGEANTKLWSQ